MSKLSNRTREILTGVLFISPWVLGFAIFGLFPIVYSLFLSLNDVTISATGIKTLFVGIGNYQAAFTTSAAMVQALMAFLKENNKI